MNDLYYLRAPGTYYQILAHPFDPEQGIEVAIVQDHRFAFSYWQKWGSQKQTGDSIPALVSLDWHEDLAGPAESEKEQLRSLDLTNNHSVALFCWEKLNPLNDGHIKAAAYLDLIGDIHILRKQAPNCIDESFESAARAIHLVRCYGTVRELLGELERGDYSDVYFDIDLDFFTESPDPCGGGKDLRLAEDAEVEAILEPTGQFMQWLFPRMRGMTIATEPEFCGGMSNSNKLYSIVDRTLFSAPLLGDSCKWKHLAKKGGGG